MHQMRYKRLKHALVFDIGDVRLTACLLHEPADLGIVDMTDAREKMVLDLEVQAAQQPVKDLAARAEVGG